jgi:hypothetical protein
LKQSNFFEPFSVYVSVRHVRWDCEGEINPTLLFREQIHSISSMGNRSDKLKCSLCNGEITFMYKPMEQWNISGNLCGDCYDRKLVEYYLPSGISTRRNT